MKTPKPLKSTSRRSLTLTQNAGKVSKPKSRYSLPDTVKLEKGLKKHLLESKQEVKKRPTPKKYNVQHNNSKVSPGKKKKSMTPEVKLGLEIEALIEKGSRSSKKERKTPTQAGKKSPNNSSLKKNVGCTKPNSSFMESKVEVPKSKTPSRRKSVFIVTEDNASTPCATSAKKIKKSSRDSSIGSEESKGGAVLNCETPKLVPEKIGGQTSFLKTPNANKSVNSSSKKNVKKQMKGVEKHFAFTQSTPDNEEEKKSFRKTPFPQEKRKAIKESSKLEASNTSNFLSEQDCSTVKSEKSDAISEGVKENSSPHIGSEGKSGMKRKKIKKKSLIHSENNIFEPMFERDTYLDRGLILDAVKAMIKLHSIKSEKSLFDAAVNIGVQINTIKIPDTTKAYLQIQLVNPVIPDSSNICLFVKDLEGKIKTPEVTEEHFKELLKQNNLNNIEVMPVSKLEGEYSTYCLKHRLARSYDKFLVDSRVAHRVYPYLGKMFYKNRKLPTPIKVANIARSIQKARYVSIINLMGKGSTFYSEIGSTYLSEEQITDNIVRLATGLNKMFPGGWKNIKSLFIKTTKTPFLPAYCSLLCPNDVPNPIVHIKKELPKPVEGELSTIPGATVVVYPTGEVKVKKKKAKEDSDDEELLLKEKIKRENENKIKVEGDKEMKGDSDEEIEGEDSDVDEEDNNDYNFDVSSSMDSDENESDDSSEEGEGAEEVGEGDNDAWLDEIEPSSPLQHSSDEEAARMF